MENIKPERVPLDVELRNLAQKEGYRITRKGSLKEDHNLNWCIVEITSSKNEKKEFVDLSVDLAMQQAIDFLLTI